MQALWYHDGRLDNHKGYQVTNGQVAHPAWIQGTKEWFTSWVGQRGSNERFHHAAQNGAHFKTCDSFLSGIFHLIFLNHGLPWVTETMESETMDKAGYIHT